MANHLTNHLFYPYSIRIRINFSRFPAFLDFIYFFLSLWYCLFEIFHYICTNKVPILAAYAYSVRHTLSGNLPLQCMEHCEGEGGYGLYRRSDDTGVWKGQEMEDSTDCKEERTGEDCCCIGLHFAFGLRVLWLIDTKTFAKNRIFASGSFWEFCDLELLVRLWINFAKVTFLSIRLRDLRKMTIFASDEMVENRVRSSQESDCMNRGSIICELFWIRIYLIIRYNDVLCTSKIRHLTLKNDGICELFDTTALSCWKLGR